MAATSIASGRLTGIFSILTGRFVEQLVERLTNSWGSVLVK